jgi:hypothetical protein
MPQKNHNEYLAYQKQYRIDNLERITAYQKNYRESDLEVYKAMMRAWYQKNRDRILREKKEKYHRAKQNNN